MLDTFDRETRNLEARYRAEAARVEAAFADHAAAGRRGKVPPAVTEKARGLYAELRARKEKRAAVMKATRPARAARDKAAQALARHEGKITTLEKRGPHLEYLIAYYAESEPDRAAQYQAELDAIPGHLAALRARLPQFQQAHADAESALAEAFLAQS